MIHQDSWNESWKISVGKKFLISLETHIIYHDVVAKPIAAKNWVCDICVLPCRSDYSMQFHDYFFLYVEETRS